MSCNSFLRLTFGDGLRSPARVCLGAAGFSLPHPGCLEAVAFFPRVSCAEDVFRMKIPRPHRNTRGRVSFPGSRKVALDGLDSLRPKCRLFWWLVPPSLCHSFRPPLTCVQVSTSACPPQQMSIRQVPVHEPKCGLTRVTFLPKNRKLAPVWNQAVCLCPKDDCSHCPPTGSHCHLHTLWGEQEGTRGSESQSQFINSDSGHALFTHLSRLLTPCGNVCNVTVSIRTSSHTAWDL